MSTMLTLVSASGWLDPAIKSAAVMLLAIVVVALSARASAAWRHFVWCLSVASLLLLPVLSLVLPDWRVDWLPQWTTKPTQVATTGQAKLVPVDHAGNAAFVVPPPAAASETQPYKERFNPPPAAMETTSAPRFSMPWLAVAWAVGVLLAVVPLAIGLWQIGGLHRHSQVIGDRRWLALLDESRRQLRVRRSVQLRQCESALAPLTWGALRPVLLLPFESGDWSDQRRRVVLLHEIAHVRRWDWLTQLIAHVACAAYWFNPLVWLAARQMRIERERACDDLVLRSGARASDYARELLALATGLSDSQVTTLMAVPMARRGGLDDRLRGILDVRRSRAGLTRPGVCLVAALAAAGITPLAMLRAAPPELKESEAVESKQTPPAARVEAMEMTVKTSRILTIGKPVPRVQVNNPDVAEITMPSETQVRVFANKPGVTQVTLFDQDDKAYTVDIIVYPDAPDLTRILRKPSPMNPAAVERPPQKVADDPPPLAVGNPEAKEVWDLTLEEALRSALANSKVPRKMGAVLFTPVVPQSDLSDAASQGSRRLVEDPKVVMKARFILSRTSEAIALDDFEAGVRNMASDVERAYWDLYYNYRNLNAVQTGRDSALQTWRKIHELFIAGAKGGEPEKEAQAREQYFLFRAQVENTLGVLYTAESRLRNMIGLAANDGCLIRPTDDPTTAEVRFDWKNVLSEGLNRSVQLRRQRSAIKQAEVKLAEARLAMSRVEDAQSIVAQSKAQLQDEELELTHTLTNSIRDLDRNYQVSRTTFNRRVAATKQVEAVKAAYDVGTATLDMLLDAQRRLSDAEIAYYRALVDYNVAILQVHYRNGSLLEYNGILVAKGTWEETSPIDPFRQRARDGD